MLGEFLGTVVASGLVSATLLSIAAFLGRSQLSHWLNKDLEALKAEHQRDLESYKVSLIAEAERAKATQEIKKATALKIVEVRFSALDRYHKAYIAIRHALPAFVLLPPAQKSAQRCIEMHTLTDSLGDAENSLDIFLSLADQQLIFDFRMCLVNHYLPHVGVGAATMPADQAAIANQTRSNLSVQVENLVKQKVEQMQQID